MAPARYAVAVMPGLDPGIHGSDPVIASRGAMDCRVQPVQPGNDSARLDAAHGLTGLEP